MKSVLYYETKVGKIGIAEKIIILQICFFETSSLDSERYLIKETKLSNK
ncbi:TPA: hypothetical protein KOP60_000506 [Clostridioides difficile]|nr:hypothetical protein [Clostridioides difficile]UWD42472.1 hypothetical protein NYF05_05755 [Clostridioides difficile]UWD46110.1 hypothetical protein NYU56_05755 [Clostridioides difficile]HBE9436263.1 hypothetical protein [Clostridioides difficile]HBE9442573.1 hypothetical protein [Clostridioides difficile]HBF4438146.1 hypothetical protein [Clostridioides difficile]